jgi:hypothetical protein
MCNNSSVATCKAERQQLWKQRHPALAASDIRRQGWLLEALRSKNLVAWIAIAAYQHRQRSSTCRESQLRSSVLQSLCAQLRTGHHWRLATTSWYRID